MKTIRMSRDFAYTPRPQVTIQYLSGALYTRVPEAVADAICKAGAGRILEGSGGQDRKS